MFNSSLSATRSSFTSMLRSAIALAAVILSGAFFSASAIGAIPVITLAEVPAASQGSPSKNMIVRPRGIFSEGMAIVFNARDLHKMAPDSEVELSLPNGKQYRVAQENLIDYRDGTKSWVGYLRDFGKLYKVIATTGPGGTYGSISTPDEDWGIVPGDGHDVLFNATREAELNPIPGDANDFRISKKKSETLSSGTSSEAIASALASQVLYSNANTWLGKAAPVPQASVDILIVVTKGFADFHGTNLNTRVNSLITTSNSTYATSEVAITLNRVGPILVKDYSDIAPTKDVALDEITNGDGIFADVEGIRNSVGADLVGLLRNVNEGGIAWIGSVAGSPPTETLGNPRFMYSVTGVCNFTGCDSVFVHELGHNMGLNHDRGNAGSPPQASRPYAFGWKIDSSNNGANPSNPDIVRRDFRTVMSYSPPVRRVFVFSNPNLFICNPTAPPVWSPPDACGVANSEDNARALNDNRFLIQNAKTASGAAVPPSIVLIADPSRFAAVSGTVSVQVYRLGDPAGSVSVNYATSNGSAVAGTDYVAASGTLSWAANDTTIKSINITTLNSGTSVDRNFSVSLSGASGPAGTAIATPSTALLTLAVPGVWPPGAVVPSGWVQSSGANASWAVSNTAASEGLYSLKSAAIPDSQKAQIEFTATTSAGNLTFSRKVSSESGFDFFKLFVDGVEVPSVTASGEVDWMAVSVPLLAGVHTIRFSFEKDTNLAVGSDAAWIDNVRLPGGSAIDLSGDGKSDLLLRNTSNGQIDGVLMNGYTFTGSATFMAPGSGWTATHTADLNGDGKADILWRHTDGRVAAWLMNGLSATAGSIFMLSGSGWTATHTADLNGDGKADILWHHTDGRVAAWLMDGLVSTGGAIFMSAGAGWAVTHTADLNGDGKADILWRHPDGTVATWLMNGLSATGGATLLAAPNAWSITHTADLNGDGKADILWRNTNGTVAAWLMNGASLAGSNTFMAAGSGWSITHMVDLNGDGKADILWRNTDGSTATWIMNGLGSTGGASLIPAPNSWTVTYTGDLNGDGKTDLIWRHPDGRLAIWLMNGAAQTAGGLLAGPGTLEIVPQP
jgi:hypothetical protein